MGYSWIYGRKVGSNDEHKLLLKSEPAESGGRVSDPEKLKASEVENTIQFVEILQDRGIEGYVIFEYDPTKYEFSPESDFYPAKQKIEIEAWENELDTLGTNSPTHKYIDAMITAPAYAPSLRSLCIFIQNRLSA